MSAPRKWLTPAEIASTVGVDIAKVHAWLKSGELVGCDLAERRGKRPRFKIHPDEFEAFLRRRQVQPAAPRLPRLKRLSAVPSYV